MNRRLLALVALLLLPGCCMFVPCHLGLWAYGTVTQAGTGTPIVGAMVSIFGEQLRTGAGGCFKFQLADGLPFEFTVKNSGDKPATSTPPAGHFHVSVVLAQEGSNGVSTISWEESGERAFVEAPACK